METRSLVDAESALHHRASPTNTVDRHHALKSTHSNITSEEDALTHRASDLHLPTPQEQAHYHLLTNIPHFMKLISTIAAQKITQQII